MSNCVIYDFETLSQDPENGVVLGMAILEYDNSKNYEYEELVSMAKYIKFDVEDQIKNYDKKIQKSTIDWWSEQNAEARKILKASDDDVSISKLYDFITNTVSNCSKVSKVFTRGNTFDPMFLRYILRSCGREDPFPWWTIRDTRSYIEGLILGSDINSNSFIPKELEDKFIHHNPIHDIVMDVMRMQILENALDDDIPF